ncbi:CU044_2847 family protein [Streptomyces sp. NBC_00829]|uniref:CU044_2847 family protein n=1 Tax=Streptomyces sp. NBC_00829 TaxID=2903679 RepID=UPI00387067FF|nr:hypothetical protein OG293_35050 [Streptomyces sp. NBC_00829]
MPALLRVPLESGGSVLVEVDDGPQAVVRVARPGGMVPEAAETLERGLESVRQAAQAVLGKMVDLPRQPDRITLALGLKLSAEAGVFLAKTAAEGSLTLTMEWDKERPETVPVTQVVATRDSDVTG